MLGGFLMLSCNRCNNVITLGQWADDWCPRAVTSGIRHTVTMLDGTDGERRLQDAYRVEHMQASYGRHQP